MSLPLTHLTTEALMNGLWQGILVFAAAWCLIRLLRPRSAAVRYVAWSMALIAIAALPLVHFTCSVLPGPQPAPAPENAGPMPELLPPATEIPTLTPAPIVVPAVSAVWMLLAVWATGTILLGLRLAAGYRRLLLLKRGSGPPPDRLRRWSARWQAAIGTGRTPDVRSSQGISAPLTAGLGAPAVLFPKALLSRLTEQDARNIWLHETAHVRRRDDWTNLAQRLIETALFFHPAVHWIGRTMNLDREIACDDWVVARTGAPRPYAECLTRLAEFASRGGRTVPALAMAAGEKQILRRVEMLISKRQPRTLCSQARGIAAILLLSASIAAIAMTQPLFVMAQSSNETKPVVAPTPPVPVEPPALASPGSPPAPPTPALAAQRTASAPPAPPAPAAQRTAPPAPPAPAAQPKPAPKPQPRSSTDRLPESVRREFEQQMRAQAEKMRAVSDEIHIEVEQSIQPHVEEIHKLADQIREKVHSQIQPSVEQIRAIEKQLREQARNTQPDEAAVTKLEEQIREIEKNTVRKAEEEIRALESQIRAYESKIRPSEEIVRKVEEKMRVEEEKMRQLEREFEKRVEESRTKEAPPAPEKIN